MIVCIGLPKTGTKSLDKAMVNLGFKTKNYFHDCLDRFEEEAAKYDVISDMPVPSRFPIIDKQHPGSKFILTVRALEHWHKSIEFWFNVHNNIKRKPKYRKAREETFGSAVYEKQLYEKYYLGHNQYILNYFKERPEDLLVMDICSGDGWDKLCPFIGMDIPNAPFPHANKRPRR